MGGDVPVDSEASVVTSSISRPDLPAQSFGGAHRGRVARVCKRQCCTVLKMHIVLERRTCKFTNVIKN